MTYVLFIQALDNAGRAVGWKEVLRGSNNACGREMNRLNERGIKGAIYTESGAYVRGSL